MGVGGVGGQAKKDMKVRTVTLTKESPTNSDESGNFQLERVQAHKGPMGTPAGGYTLEKARR